VTGPQRPIEDRLRDEWVDPSIEMPVGLLESVRRSVRETPHGRLGNTSTVLRWLAVASAAVVVGAVLVVGGGPEPPDGPSPSAPTSTPRASASADPGPVDAAIGLPGAWETTAVPPIGGRGGHVLVWTGREALAWGGMESTPERTVFDGYHPRGGAAYDPVTDTWRVTADAPIEGRYRPLAAWTGAELIIWGGWLSDREATDGAAYDPATDTWRLLPPAPLGRGDAVGGWVADRLVVITSDGAATYDPDDDAWTSIPAPPIRPEWRTAAVSAGLLVVIAYGDGATGRVEGAVLHPPTGGWEPVDVPLEPLDAGIEIFGAGDVAVIPAAGQALDPVRMTWRPIVPCRDSANGAAWTGRHLIGVGAAYDVEGDRCLALPPAPLRAEPFQDTNGREFAVGLWTGDRYLTWSAGTGTDIVWLPNDGAIFRPDPETTPVPSDEPSPAVEATIPADLPSTAAHEERGIRVSVVLDRNPLQAGQVTWATLEVRNVGTDDLVWFHDGCSIPVRLWGEMTDATWRPGVEQTGPAADFKRMATRRYASPEGTVVIDFVPEPFIGRGSYGCTDTGFTEYLEPGETRVQRAQWNGMAGRRLGLPPSGPVRLTVRADYYWRATDPEPEDITTTTLTFEMPAWIESGRDPRLLHPPEVVDAAVADPEFMAQIVPRLPSGHDPVLQFVVAAGAWEVGLLGYDRRTYYLALVAPRSGEVLGLIERPWDPDVDGFP